MEGSKKLNPGLDISLHILPLDLAQVFGNGNECHLEIGFGDGDFLIENALKNPGKNYLGIEIKKRRFNKAVRNSTRAGAANVRFIHMDAEIAAEELFPPDSFSSVYINFPDPWPKDRHRKYRVINHSFVKKLSGIIKSGGNLEIASDHKEYILSALDIMSKIDSFECVYPSRGYVQRVSDRTETSYEREFRAEGREIYYLRFRITK
ncbi:MAG: tRNA (guanosine(46)-N7)-methyltransferase TrmB [Thermodesulfobacteriota bacterium]